MVISEDPEAVKELRTSIEGMSFTHSIGFLAGRMSHQILDAAARHGERCEGCETCQDLTRLVSAVAVQRELLRPDDSASGGTFWRVVRWLMTPVGGR